MQQTYTDAILDIHQLLACTEEAFAAWLHTLARRNLFDAIRLLEAEKRGGQRRRVKPGAGQ
jgi:DNA-directed RNA polymerase specialized sigma24 family protein